MPRADAAPRTLAARLGELAAAMAAHYNEEQFFRGLLAACGTSTLLLSSALKAAADERDDSVSHELTEVMSHCDLAVPKRGYLRFVHKDEDVLPQGEALAALPCVQDPRHDYRCLLCISPRQLSLTIRAEEHPERLFFPLSDLPAHYVALSQLDPLCRPARRRGRQRAAGEREADVRACRRLNVLLEDLLSANEHLGEAQMQGLHVFLCRILFCLYAEDSGLFEEDQFAAAVRGHVGRDGTGARRFFSELFAVLATPAEQRTALPRAFPASLRAFPHVGGGLFEGACFLPRFDTAAYNQLVACCDLRWRQITPAIFGAMFQNAMDPAARRQEGAHYTAEANILRVIRPLFLDELHAELSRIMAMAPRRRAVQLHRLQERIAQMRFLDPACGCGNFLLITYRELRRLENRILLELQRLRGCQGELSSSLRQRVSIAQFYGLELEHWPVQIAHVSMYLMELALHQESSATLGRAIPALPPGRSDCIRQGNALLVDWNEVLPAEQCGFVMGNPPFVSTNNTDPRQKAWLRECYPARYRISRADYCTGWFVKAADYMAGNRELTAAFVATNSICQGGQVATLWGLLLARGMHLHFAWPSFAWRNEAGRGAVVTVIIVGFAPRPPAQGARLLRLSAAGQVTVQCGPALTPYLTLGHSAGVIVRRTHQALSAPLEMIVGVLPADGGHLILEFEEGERLLAERPQLRPFIRRYVGGAELMAGTHRYCLWLKDEEQEQWRQHPEIMLRVEACRAWRERQVKSGDAYRLRQRPWSFREQRPLGEALVVPQTTSERRPYVPLSFVDARYVVSVKALMIPGADEAHFAVLSSRMHMCWLRLTGGRLETRYSYLRDLVYNTFIWPQMTQEQRQELWELGNEVLMVREHYYQQELGALYSHLPPALLALHQRIDEQVERLYRPEPFADDEERTGFMLDLYARTAGMPADRE